MLIEATTFNHLKRLSSPLRLAPPTGGSEQVAIGLLAAVLLLVFVSAVAPGTQAAEPLAVEYLWQHEPDLGFSWQPPEVSPQLDITAADFESPYAHTRLRAAQTALRLTQQSRQEPQLLQAIMNRLEKGETQPYVRAAFVAAACAIDDGSLAERLWQICKGDPLTRPTVEQACIGWSSPVCVELWRKSLLDSTATDQERIRALNGLGAAGEQQDLELLTNEVTDGAVPASRRLAAAKAIGRLTTSDQLKLATQLRASSATDADLLAVLVLGKQTSPELKKFVNDVASHGSAVAQRQAFRWMCEYDSETARAQAVNFAKHGDSEIRRMSLEQLAKIGDDSARSIVVEALRDGHPSLREFAREILLENASRSPAHQRSVEEIVARELDSEDWRALEQALRLAVEMQLAPHVPRMLELLEHQRPEVGITAAWGLRNLATEPDSLQAMLEHAELWTQRLGGEASPEVAVQEFDLRRTAHLLEAFGARRYTPAQTTLLKFVPKNGQRMGLITRMAGIWACGKMWEGQRNEGLVNSLNLRLSDVSGQFPELESIRYTVALAMGWLADPAASGTLEQYGEEPPNPIGYASAWAKKRIDSAAAER